MFENIFYCLVTTNNYSCKNSDLKKNKDKFKMLIEIEIIIREKLKH